MEKRIGLARILVTLPALFLAIGPPLADLNATHATNPLWPGHARLHVVWLVSTNALIAVLALILVWRPSRPPGAAPVRQAAALVGVVLIGFFVAAATQTAYAGSLTDPNGIPFQIGSVDANLAGFTVCAGLLAGGVALTRRAPV
jgi:hypothetical protein